MLNHYFYQTLQLLFFLDTGAKFMLHKTCKCFAKMLGSQIKNASMNVVMRELATVGRLPSIRWIVEFVVEMHPTKGYFFLERFIPLVTNLILNNHTTCLKYLKANLPNFNWKRDCVVEAFAKANPECLKFYVEDLHNADPALCSYAAEGGRLDNLVYLIQIGCVFNSKAPEFAARHGHLDCLRYLIEKDRNIVDKVAIAWAAFKGHLEIVKYLFTNGFELTKKACESAAGGGQLHVLQWAHELGFGYLWDSYTCSSAAAEGHLDCLKFLHENGCEWDQKTCDNAAHGGHLNCLAYAHENGCAWSAKTSREAGDSISCMRYLHENGCEWHEKTCSAAATSIECLRYAHENGCPWDKKTCRAAASNNSLVCLQYAHENGCPWDSQTCLYAAIYGYLDCLIYAHENGCAWNAGICENAAKNGHLDCLRYAHENGCEWIAASVCSNAAYNGHLACLRYAHENGCEWKYNICILAAYDGTLDCVEHAQEKEITWDYLTYLYAIGGGHLACLKYAHEKGCVKTIDELNSLSKKIFRLRYEYNRDHLILYMFENLWKLDDNMVITVINSGYLDILKLAHGVGCKINRQVCDRAKHTLKQKACVKFIRNNYE